MKGLYKKIGIGVLAAALVAGASLSQGAIVYAKSQLRPKPKPAAHKCDYQLAKPRLANEKIDKLFNKDKNDEKDMFGYQKDFKYIVDGPIFEGELVQSSDVRYAGRYESPLNFFSCLDQHRNQLDEAAQGIPNWYKIGNWNYKLQIINK